MRSLNYVQLCGNLGKDVEIKTTQTGMQMCTLSVATSKPIKDSPESKTSWHKVVCFKDCAHALRGARKGEKVLVCGEIEYSKYTDKNGIERDSVAIIASHAALIKREPASLTTSADYLSAKNSQSYSSHNDDIFGSSELNEDLPF